jgi:hypothetical protein
MTRAPQTVLARPAVVLSVEDGPRRRPRAGPRRAGLHLWPLP